MHSERPPVCGVCTSSDHSTASHEERLDAVEAAREIEYAVPPERQHSKPPSKKKKKTPSKTNDVSTDAPKEKKSERTVDLGVGMLRENVRDAIGFLVGDPDLYQRGGEFVRVVRITSEQESTTKDKNNRPSVYAGTPTLMNCPAAHMTARMDDIVPTRRWSKTKDDFVRCSPPINLVNAVLQEREYPGIRYLRGVAETPFLRPDGTICQRPGYDKATGFLYAPLTVFPEVPENPTQRDAEKAYKKLFRIYEGLEFVNDTARAVPIAGILTILAQAAIQGCTPVFLIEANTPGTGKTNVIDTIGIITMGRPMPRRSFPGPGEELRKVLDSYARDGTRFFLLDNIGQDFGGEALEMAITTEGEYDLRVLGETRNLRVEWRAAIFGSGNNVGYHTADIVPRVLVGRMETASEEPRSRDPSTFLIKEELRSYVRRHRVELAVASLTILRAYAAAGRPDQHVKPWGSFEAFNALVPQAIRFAGGPDVNQCRYSGESARAADTDSQHLMVILEMLPKLYIRLETGWLSASSIIEALYDPARYGNDPLYDHLRTAIEGITSKKRTGQIRPNPQGLGLAFRRLRGRVVSGKRLIDMIDKHHNAQMWRVERIT